MTSKDVLSDCLPSDTSTGISSLVNLNNYEDQKSTFKTFSGLKCYHVNVHSLLPKLDEIRYIVSDLKIQCLSVSESFLSPDIGYHEIMEGDQSKNSVCYLEISYSTLDSVSLLILNINNVLL